MEKELLQKALDSILHGSTQIITETDGYGNVQQREVRINDLRVPLVGKLAEKLVQTEGFRTALEKAFTPEVIKKIIETTINNVKFSDLPYRTQERLKKEMEGTELSVRKFTLVAEVVDEKLT